MTSKSKAAPAARKRTKPTAPPTEGGAYDEESGELLERTQEAPPEGPKQVEQPPVGGEEA